MVVEPQLARILVDVAGQVAADGTRPGDEDLVVCRCCRRQLSHQRLHRIVGCRSRARVDQLGHDYGPRLVCCHQAVHVRRHVAPACGRVCDEGLVEIRGQGLMIGIELDRPCGPLVNRALEAGLLINVTVDRVIRLLPPLIISDEQAEAIVDGVSGLVRDFLKAAA